jgi:hypothetical protein
VRHGVPHDLDRDLATRIAIGGEANFPRLRELFSRENSLGACKRRLRELEEFVAEISRDRNLGNCVTRVRVTPFNLKPENDVRSLRDSGYEKSLA